ncbi:MAG: hypothetical protein ACREFQ_14910, partial [Stellaceae bacterium]
MKHGWTVAADTDGGSGPGLEIGRERSPLAYAMGSAGLRFLDPEIEGRFQHAHVSEGLSTICTFLLSGSLLYGVFGILDYYVMPHEVHIIWAIRYGFVCPWLITVALLTRTRFFLRAAQLLVSFSMFIAGFGILVMTAIATAPGNALYYAGLIMVVIYGASLV